MSAVVICILQMRKLKFKEVVVLFCFLTKASGYVNFPGGSDGRASAYNAGDSGSVPGLGRSPGEGNGTPLQYSCLEKSHGRRSLAATVHGVAKSQTQPSDFSSTFTKVR